MRKTRDDGKVSKEWYRRNMACKEAAVGHWRKLFGEVCDKNKDLQARIEALKTEHAENLKKVRSEAVDAVRKLEAASKLDKADVLATAHGYGLMARRKLRALEESDPERFKPARNLVEFELDQLVDLFESD